MTPARLLLLEELLAEFGEEFRPLLDRPLLAGSVNVTRMLVSRVRGSEEAALATTGKGTP